MKRTCRLLIVLAALVVVAAACIPPAGPPGSQARNDHLEAVAGTFAIGLNVTVAPLDDGTTKACPDNAGVDHWGTTRYDDGQIEVCYSLGLPTSNAHRGTVYMHEMGHAYAHRLEDVGATWRQGPINDLEKFADCFAQLHAGNTAFNNYWGGQPCAQSWIDKVIQIETFLPPNGAGWWPTT